MKVETCCRRYGLEVGFEVLQSGSISCSLDFPDAVHMYTASFLMARLDSQFSGHVFLSGTISYYNPPPPHTHIPKLLFVQLFDHSYGKLTNTLDYASGKKNVMMNQI